ncbi:WXG100 family type VII secretion target [Kutzneria albida]|nr:WXG100 family type VII secretion target [Kutzneria albida]
MSSVGGSGMESGRYEVRPEAMRAAAGNVGGIILQTINAVLGLESLLVAPTSFAAIGDAVASGNTAMQAQQVAALQSLLKGLQAVNDLVKRSADDYDQADRAIAQGFGGGGGTDSGPTSTWSSPAASAVAAHAVSDSIGATGDPNSVGNVLDYLGQAGLGHASSAGLHAQDGGQFADWLDASPDHQAGVGVLGVYAGVARDFGDVPGGVHPGDVVVVDNGSGSVIGIAGQGGRLYNHGLVTPDFGALATVRVYRPMAAATSL